MVLKFAIYVNLLVLSFVLLYAFRKSFHAVVKILLLHWHLAGCMLSLLHNYAADQMKLEYTVRGS